MLPPVFQNPIVEYIFEFLIKQAIQYGPDLARKAWTQRKRPSAKQILAPRVGVIGREVELRAIQNVLDESPHLRILYFTGEGGVGKTRLLEETKHLVDEKTHSPLRWSGILDLYHTELHTTSALQAAIVQGLDPIGEYFQRFRSVYDRLNLLLQEGLTGHTIEVEREKLNDVFLEDYRAFSKKYRPVLAFDTLESMVHESDWVENICNIEGGSIAARDWLTEQIGTLENSVILMAGRPDNSLRNALERANNNYPGQLEIIEIKGLTREDTHELLELLIKNAPASLKPLREKTDQLWQVTSGLPVQLALSIDLASNGELIPLPNNENRVVSYGQSLVNTLFPYDHPNASVFFLLALARKGMTAELLHYLEPERSKMDCQQQLEQLRLKTIIKLRPQQGEIFLHDALYELFDQYSPDQDFLEPWYERFADYYRARQLVGSDVYNRSTTSINLLYYELYRAPRWAFESVYLKLREIALKGHELELDLQLRDELLRFIHLPTNGLRPINQKLTLAEIDRDGVLRWIKRYLIQGQYYKSILIAETILTLSPQLYQVYIPGRTNQKERMLSRHEEYAREILESADSLFWGQLLTYYCEALIYLNPLNEKIDQMLYKASTLLNSQDALIKYDSSLNWLSERVLGRLHDRWGYLFRSNGSYGGAVREYEIALSEFIKNNIIDEQAATTNNLAFILALLGASEQAKIYADQALELRQRIGQKYPLALSYNTRGLIYTLQGQFDLGRRDCQLALSIFEELETPRGIGLACNAIGYILRKQGEGWELGKITTDQAVQCFQQSNQYLERAAIVFSGQISEPIRLWESYNEQGSLFREWGYLLRDQCETDAAHEFYSKAINYQLKALEVAKQYKMHFQEADTYDDLAKTSQDQGDNKKEKYWLKYALSIVPKNYILTPNQKRKDIPAHGEAYWLILGKTHWQEGFRALKTTAKSRVSETRYQEYTQNVIFNFTFAAYYFERYWPDTSTNRARMLLMADQIKALVISKREVKRAIKAIASQYRIDVGAFLNIFDIE